MREPGHHFCQLSPHLSGRQRWAVDHNDRQAQSARGSKFGRSAVAAGIFGHNMRRSVALHQSKITGLNKGAARNLDGAIWQGQIRLGRIDQAQQIVMLRFGGKHRQILLSDCEKNPRRGLRQRRDRRRYISHMLPSIIRSCLPGRAFKGAERHGGRSTACNRIAAHLRCKGMGGVNHMSDDFTAQIGGQSFGTAKSTNTRGQRLFHGFCRAPGIGKHRVMSRLRQSLGQPGRLSGASQQKDACHV